MSTSPADSQKLQAQMKDISEGFVESSRKILELEYDFSPKSLQVLDQALAVYHPEGFHLENAWHGHAAYVGEVVRKALGGTWSLESDGSGASLRGVGGKATIYPFLWMSKRIDAVKSGSVADGKVADKFVKLLQALGRAGEAPEAIPHDFVSAKAGGNAPAAAAGNNASDEGDDEMPDFGVEVLQAGPTICFFLVSASDGKIDKKEVKSFFGEVLKFATHPNPLVRDVFGATPHNFEAFAKELMENPANAILKLIAVRKVADEHHPQHSAGFCAALLEMSKNIAAASGGFFGFGNKISKDEQEALDMIQKMLQL